MRADKSNHTFLALIVLFILCLFGVIVHAIISILLSLGTGNLNKLALERSPELPAVDKVYNQSNYENLMWFVHITDIHISKYRAPERVDDLKKFCNFIREKVKPPIVVATGDLTDAKTADNLASTQAEEEWMSYADVVKNYCKASTPGKTGGQMTWLDIRGNHDTFNVASDEEQVNFFNKYSIQGTVTSRRRSYHHSIDHKGSKYSFVGIDATLSPGPKRPFNFFGGLTTSAMAEVDGMLDIARRESDSGLIVFGHFPLSTIVSPSPGIKKIVGKHNVNAYLSGHLHNLLNLVPSLHTKQPEGFLDLELADWKDNRRYRILAFDEGHLSFTDRNFDANLKDTVVLITRPLNVKYMYHDLKKTLSSMEKSTHIRILVFSQKKISSVIAEIDDGRETLECAPVDNGPLYVARWFPKKYADGRRHRLVVKVVIDNIKEEVVEAQDFAVDEQAVIEELEEFGFLQRLILMSDVYVLFQLAFSVSMFSIIGPMCLFRLLHKLTIQGSLSSFRSPHKNSYCRPIKKLFYQITKSLWLVSNLDRIFYPVTLAMIYVAFGPWAIGYFIEDSIGVVFSWGMIINGVWLPTYTTLIYYCWFMIPYWLMLLTGVCWTVNKKHNEIITNRVIFTPTFCGYLFSNWWMVVIMILQAFHCLEFYITYGLLSIFGVCGLFRIIFVYFIWSRAVSTRSEDFVNANLINIFKTDKQKS